MLTGDGRVIRCYVPTGEVLESPYNQLLKDWVVMLNDFRML